MPTPLDANLALWWRQWEENARRNEWGPFDPALANQDWSQHPWVGTGQPGEAAWRAWVASGGTSPPSTTYPTEPADWYSVGGGYAQLQPTQAAATVEQTQAAATVEQQNATARAKASQLLYNAMRGLPFMGQDALSALSAGQAPAPNTMTPQTLSALSGDQFLSDNFFALLEASGIYPTSYLAEVARFQPKGAQAAPSFI